MQIKHSKHWLRSLMSTEKGGLRIDFSVDDKYLFEKFEVHFRKHYGSKADTPWKKMTRYQMLIKYIGEQGSLFLPEWDAFFLYKIEQLAKTDRSVAKQYFTEIRGATLLKFEYWLRYLSDIELGSLENESNFGECTLKSENFNGRCLSIVIDNKAEKVLVYKDVLIQGWEVPGAVFIDEVALCSFEKVKNIYRYGLMHLSGKMILTPTLAWINDQLTDTKLVRFKKENKYGYINLNGEVVVDPIFDQVIGDNVTDTLAWTGYLTIKINNKFGLMDMSLNEILPCIYDEVEVYDEGTFGEKEDYLFTAKVNGRADEVFRLVNDKLMLVKPNDNL